MEVGSIKDSSSVRSSPFPSPNLGALLKIKTMSWSQETGLPITVKVHVADRIFNLHKHQLISKSGYFMKRLKESMEVELSPDFPGGICTFEMIALFMYGYSTMVDAFNIASLRCAAEFLEMTEEFCPENICRRFDLYLNQVVLQKWEDTLIVLKTSEDLLPFSEELLIVSRCVESLAFMACMEILDPDGRRDKPVVTLETFSGCMWSSEMANNLVSEEHWIRDLIVLAFPVFKRIIHSLRRQGMREKYVSPIIIFYADKWLLSHKITENDNSNRKDEMSLILQGIIEMLPLGEKAGRCIPVGFYFSLLAVAVEVNLLDEAKRKLEAQIASLLHFAEMDDFLHFVDITHPISSTIDLATIMRIFSESVSYTLEIGRNPSIVVDLWDSYISRIANCADMKLEMFSDLVEIIPLSSRKRHDNLLRAISTFLQAHPETSQEDRESLCRYIDCQKLSQQAQIEAVQSELMPLRLIIQALFIQQMNTRQAFEDCSGSFRCMEIGDFPENLRPKLKIDPFEDRPYIDKVSEMEDFRLLVQNDHPRPKSEFLKKEFERTSFRIRTIEHQLLSLKRSLECQDITEKFGRLDCKSNGLRCRKSLEKNTLIRKKNPLLQVSACICSVNNRKYASGLLKIFRKLSLLGRMKPRSKTGIRCQSHETLNSSVR